MKEIGVQEFLNYLLIRETLITKENQILFLRHKIRPGTAPALHLCLTITSVGTGDFDDFICIPYQ